jgi:hypothetical protein
MHGTVRPCYRNRRLRATRRGCGGWALLLAKQWQYVCKCVLSERWKSFSSRRSPACSRTELRRREAGRGVPGGEGPVRNASELDSAGCFGEPAAKGRSPDRKRKPVTLRGSVSKRWRGTPGGWRRNGRKAKQMTQRDLAGTKRCSSSATAALRGDGRGVDAKSRRPGVRGVVVARKRRKRRGVAKGWDFHRWPNAFFAEQGLYSLVAAHASACQSSRR